MKDSPLGKIASLGARDGSLGESAPTLLWLLGSGSAMANHTCVMIHLTAWGLQPSLSPGSQPGSVATFDHYILGCSQSSNGSAVESMAQTILASPGGRAVWAMLLGKEEDALCAWAGYRAGAEKTQPWPWAMVRSPAGTANTRTTSVQSCSLITVLADSSFKGSTSCTSAG